MKTAGIEKINFYGCSLCLRQAGLALARGRDPKQAVDAYMVNTRSLNPPYEDAVTMAANAARLLLTEEDRQSIGMLIVGTEGGVDFGKPISTHLHQALGLSPRVVNFETKHACYSGVAALKTALHWIASGLNRGQKALVINTDLSRKHFHKDIEFVLGGAAAALLISETPKVIEYELERTGVWTKDVYDTFRPTARDEEGNNEVSLYTYQDALEGAYRGYASSWERPIDFDAHFDFNIYHMPFPGMAFQAHRVLCNLARPRGKQEIRESFTQKVQPSLHYATRIGTMYGASNFIGLCGLVQKAEGLRAGARVGFYAYGSGAIGEFYSGRIRPEARSVLAGLALDQALDERREVSIEEYEMIEKIRDGAVEQPDFMPDFSLLDDWYAQHYQGRGYLVLKAVKKFHREYAWS